MENTSDCNNFHCRKGIELTVPFISTDVIAYRGCRKKNPDLGRSYVLDWCHFTTLSWRFLCRIGLPYLRSVPKLLHSAEFYRNIRNWRLIYSIFWFIFFNTIIWYSLFNFARRQSRHAIYFTVKVSFIRMQLTHLQQHLLKVNSINPKRMNGALILLNFVISRLASIGTLGKEKEPGVGKLGWHWNFDTGFKWNIKELFRSKSHVRVFWTFLK